MGTIGEKRAPPDVVTLSRLSDEQRLILRIVTSVPVISHTSTGSVAPPGARRLTVRIGLNRTRTLASAGLDVVAEW